MTDSPGIRALGVADSARPDWSSLAGAVVRGDRVFDGASFATATVGGLDATDGVLSIVEDVDREDLRVLLVGTIAPAWFNLIELDRLHAETGLPTIAVTFEESDGLEPALADAFSGDALEARLERYRALPARHAVTVNDETVYVRTVGLSTAEAATLVRTFTPEGGRPEPIRVARALARAGADYRARIVDGDSETR